MFMFKQFSKSSSGILIPIQVKGWSTSTRIGKDNTQVYVVVPDSTHAMRKIVKYEAYESNENESVPKSLTLRIFSNDIGMLEKINSAINDARCAEEKLYCAENTVIVSMEETTTEPQGFLAVENILLESIAPVKNTAAEEKKES